MERKPEEINFYSPGERLFLLYDYLLKNTNREYVVTPKQINNYLNDHGIFLEKKAIYADFEKLRSATGLEIVWNAHKQGYQILNPPFEPYELRLMVDSIQASKFITQTEARRISLKITGLADVHTKASLDRQSYVSNRIRNREDSVVKDTDKIHACIRDDRKVAFRYFHYTPSKQRQFSKKGDLYILIPKYAIQAEVHTSKVQKGAVSKRFFGITRGSAFCFAEGVSECSVLKFRRKLPDVGRFPAELCAVRLTAFLQRMRRCGSPPRDPGRWGPFWT